MSEAFKLTHLCSAGSRDSALTNHGYHQATRLGAHFAGLGLVFTHIFSSHLQRAAKTAALIRDAQVMRRTASSATEAPAVVTLPILMEQDFGFYEGEKFSERAADGKHPVKQHHQARKASGEFVDVESKDSLGQRADTFLDDHLLPLLGSKAESIDPVIVIVSHGIMLSSLWKRLLSRLPERRVKLTKELAATASVTLEHLGGWSNTGYLELHMSHAMLDPSSVSSAVTPDVPILTSSPSPIPRPESLMSAATCTDDLPRLPVVSPVRLTETTGASKIRMLSPGWSTVICTINGKDHLTGLKRTGGGVGSSRHDDSQKSIENFFKRRKIG